MMRQILTAAMLIAAPFASSGALAQAPRPNPGVACPGGTHYATIRHNLVKPGQWAAFEEAVAAHNAWYVAHANKTTTRLSRVIALASGAPSLSTAEAVTITVYTDAPQPAHDAAYDAFTAKYRASSSQKDEARVCL
jgi:hypothetical protein